MHDRVQTVSYNEHAPAEHRREGCTHILALRRALHTRQPKKSDNVDQFQEAKGVLPLGAGSQQISQARLDEGVCPLVNTCSCLIKRYDDSVLHRMLVIRLSDMCHRRG